MNERLAFQILSRIRNGMQGYRDILNDIKQQKEYFNLRDQEFAETIAALKENECIKNLSAGHPKHYELNHNKDCFSIYEERIAEEDRVKNEERKLKWYETELARKRYEDYPKIEFRANMAIIISALSVLISLVLGLLKMKEW